MKIAITGGAGFVGSHVARAYLDAGHDVLVIDSFVAGSRQLLDPRAGLYAIDIRDGKLHTILQQERPDILSHHAAQREHSLFGISPLTDADIHIRGLLNVLDACVSASITKIIFASGGNSLYGLRDSPDQLQETVRIVRESTPLCPQFPYDITKVAGEAYVRYYTHAYGLQHTILRYADIYGEPSCEFAHHPLSYFITMLVENQRPVIRRCMKEIRDHIFIDDVVRANLLALDRAPNATVHISSGQGYDLDQFYCAAAQLLHSDLVPVYVSGALSPLSAIALDNTLARQLLRWQPEISFSEGVRLAVERLCGKVEQPVPASEHVQERSVAVAMA